MSRKSVNKPISKKQSPIKNIINPITPRTPGQARFLEAVNSHEITICNGPAGTGKTLISFGSALKAYIQGECDRIIIVRPTIHSGDDNELGYLPGDINDKMAPFIAPFAKDAVPLLLKQDNFRTNLNHSDRGAPDPTTALLRRFDIEIIPLAYIRGRTFNNSFCILDEAQNCTLNDFKLFLTRIGQNSRVIIEGDSTQSDIDDSGLVPLMSMLDGIDQITTITLTEEDIVRNALIAKILKRFNR